MRIAAALCLVTLLAAVAACGGSGGSRGDPPLETGAPPPAPEEPALVEPFDAVETPVGILVADRGASALILVDRESGSRRTVASVPAARELELVDDASALVSSGAEIRRVDLASWETARIARAEAEVLGLARAETGDLYVSEGGSTIARIAASGEREVLVEGRDEVHGLLLVDEDRLVACEAGAGNVLEIDLRSGEVATLASDLDRPSFAAPAPEGGLYVSEFGSGRITLLRVDGSRLPLADVPEVGPLSTLADGSLLAATLAPDVVRVDTASGEVQSLLR